MIYVRHPGHRRVTAIRVVSAGGYRPASVVGRPPTGAGSPLAPAGAPSVHDLVSDQRAGTIPTTTAPSTTVALRRATAPPNASSTTVAPDPLPTGPPAGSAAAPTTTTPLTPLLQKIVPTAAAVLGLASWFDAPGGTCAHRDLPLGTIVKVTRTSTGASATCRVNDRGPSLATNRVIDLSFDTFQKLASPDTGVIEVRIEW